MLLDRGEMWILWHWMHYTWFNVGKVPPAWICIDCTSHGYWGFFCWIVILCCVISFIPQAFPPSSFDRLSYAKSVFAYCKWSKTEQWEGLGTRLLFENIINIQTALNSVITIVFSCTVLFTVETGKHQDCACRYQETTLWQTWCLMLTTEDKGEAGKSVLWNHTKRWRIWRVWY